MVSDDAPVAWKDRKVQRLKARDQVNQVRCCVSNFLVLATILRRGSKHVSDTEALVRDDHGRHPLCDSLNEGAERCEESGVGSFVVSHVLFIDHSFPSKYIIFLPSKVVLATK